MKHEFKKGDSVLVKATVRTDTLNGAGEVELSCKRHSGDWLNVMPDQVIPAPEYEVGEEVEVTNHYGETKERWKARYYVGELAGKYITSRDFDSPYLLHAWSHIRKLQKEPTISLKLEINGVTTKPCDVSEETWLKIREASK